MSNAKLRTSLGSISHNFIAERRCEITSVMRWYSDLFSLRRTSSAEALMQ